MHSILFATSEAYPLIKTGGLADVAASLPRALLKLGHDVRILLPAYESLLAKAASQGLKTLGEISLDDINLTLHQTRLPGTRVTVWLVDIPEFSARAGNPYCGADGNDWYDNHLRFYWFARAAEAIALNQAGLNWQPDIVHCNDWQTGLIPALLSLHPERPATLFTIHNLAYRGLFSYQAFGELNLPPAFWHHERLEFYGQMSFMKGGLAFADFITTVSPSYAQEIQLPEHGYGLDGLIRYRQESLSGILNGIDTDEWNPGKDKHLAATYNRRTLGNKTKNKLALQETLGLALNADVPLLGFIGRLVDQKGIDLILNQLPLLLEQDCQLVVLGSGFPHYEQRLREVARQYPDRVSVTIGYDEGLAHQIEAGCDIFLMPSIFEPCGLNQMYSLRYGTLPVVHAVGGLKDTVQERPLDNPGEDANGFVFHSPDALDLHAAILRALDAYRQPATWKQLQINAMNRDSSWEQSAKAYEAIYANLCS
ncbi:glycogen synthase GlgA [Cellvibrio japonicus]|uniref:Glycogen synthase n=1 Tax=Cellvibrio japonicus (strain Ueda107) TaxID=498211 RepID=GLGA_CELJU|nr:glycogen synthase GlgA [Cellvibrio japonicus]B3PGN5.1 RecName: Full=Glycogen synthase; AltName: Full=Starch [bacterial glycogen] synthase [Cellvibrio japonicus Ueda107]ACE84974.1 ADP-glucose:starch glucosyltransferase, gt5A [Cellvibrio japonicus Ueda107]QEI12381.1 glycogen synthase GlgA [Cellvibrio japonicus]QEI15954.1 glycogen synthase GlgA [Cellvibrio japonicus]QEI19533.1 glycogen synthase GlgA [Cellvibrio japonicus]